MRWYRSAAEQGNVKAQSNLGIMYLIGQGAQGERGNWFPYCDHLA